MVEGADVLADPEYAVVEEIDIRPQPGPQESALRSHVDVLVYGGAAGAGKSYELLLEPLRAYNVPGFDALILRRETVRITEVGGLWDTSIDLYPLCQAKSNYNELLWEFPSGAKVKFGHMEHEKDRMKYAGSQIALLAFDQVEEFTEKQFWFMFSRLRSMSGVKPYVRTTCNPVPDSDKIGGWLRHLIDWYIDDATGLPNLQRAGKTRWFARPGDVLEWGNTKKELIDRFGKDCLPMSFTFIPGKVTDNPALLKRDPAYLTKLRALPRVDRERLLYGNWNVRETAGMFFQRQWFPVVSAAPTRFTDVVRYWDRAATPAEQAKGKGSWTAGVKMGKTNDGRYFILDIVRFQGSPLQVEQAVVNTASQDGLGVRVGIEQDPGQAGKAEARYHVSNLAGYEVKKVGAAAMTKKLRNVQHFNFGLSGPAKGVRARPVSAQVEAGNVYLVTGAWIESFLREAENFDGSDKCTSDQIDALSGAFHMLVIVKRAGIWGA